MIRVTLITGAIYEFPSVALREHPGLAVKRLPADIRRVQDLPDPEPRPWPIGLAHEDLESYRVGNT